MLNPRLPVQTRSFWTVLLASYLPLLHRGSCCQASSCALYTIIAAAIAALQRLCCATVPVQRLFMGFLGLVESDRHGPEGLGGGFGDGLVLWVLGGGLVGDGLVLLVLLMTLDAVNSDRPVLLVLLVLLGPVRPTGSGGLVLLVFGFGGGLTPD